VPYGAIVSGHVFVSYSPVDEIYVRRLVGHLRSSGVEVWLDDEVWADSDDGEHWDRVIAGMVDSCAAFVTVMTPESGRSESVGREVARARDSHRPILPLLLAGQPVLGLPADDYEDVVGRRMPAPDFVARLRELAPGAEPVTPLAEASAQAAGADSQLSSSAGRPPSWVWTALRGVLCPRRRAKGTAPSGDVPQ
jgi:TIR domain